MYEHSMSYISYNYKYPHLLSLVLQCLPVQFLLDSITMAPVITAHQAEGESVLFALYTV